MGATWHLGQKTNEPSNRTTPGALQHGLVRCGRSGRQTAITTSPLNTLGTKTAAGCTLQDANFGKMICADCQSRCRLPRRNAKAHDVARSSHQCCNPLKSSDFSEIVTVHITGHQCRANQNQ